MHYPLQRYIKLALWNLCIVAAIGFILRYKISYSFPYLDQKHLLHGHSHFAFTGWVTQVLLVLLTDFLSKFSGTDVYKKYKWLLNANLVAAYGMLISFPIQGYGFISISFSTLSIIIFYFFAITYWKDLDRLSNKHISFWWIKASLVFNVLSSAGAFALAYMMANKVVHQNWYLAAVYFFLHFQYNGWFFFACMGLVIPKIFKTPFSKNQKLIFWLFAGACIPAYVLSALWLPIPKWTYTIVVLAAFCQVAGWAMILQHVKKQIQFIKSAIPVTFRWIFILSALALSIKLLLQLGSTIPVLSNLAFGFRPIVIGYLHLILLGVITLFLLGYLFRNGFIPATAKMLNSVKLFAAGIIINELLLMIQGVAAMYYFPVPYINEMLLGAAGVMLAGIFMLNYYNFSKNQVIV